MEVVTAALWLFIAIIAVWDAVTAVRRAWVDRSSTLRFQVAVICILTLMIIAVVLWQ